MVAPIGNIASPSQGVGYFEKDGYYAKDDGAHREASAWVGRGASCSGLRSSELGREIIAVSGSHYLRLKLRSGSNSAHKLWNQE